MRLVLIFVALALLISIPFLVWGGKWEGMFTGEAAATWIARHGIWLAILLLATDVFLPVPATAVMSALGYIYGPWAGGLAAAAGSFLAGLLAWVLCRCFGQRAALRLMGPRDYEKGMSLFAGNTGGWLVALSRWLPLLPEVVACMAGLTRMPAMRFLAALACGCFPAGFAFAAIGAAGREKDMAWLAIALSIAVPCALYPVARRLLNRHARVRETQSPVREDNKEKASL